MLFDKIKAAFSSSNQPAVDEPPSASEYVDWLFRYMLSKSRTEMEIDSTRPLPGADEAPCAPPHAAVLNRLKVLCGLNPFRFSEPVDGAFEKAFSNHTLHFSTRFEDNDSRSVCRLRLSIRA